MHMGPIKLSVVLRGTLYVAAAVSIAVTAIHFRQNGQPIDTGPHLPRTDAVSLVPELMHCQAMGMAAEDDPACKEAWSEIRRRFFTYKPSDEAPIKQAIGRQTAAQPEGR